MGEVYNKDKLIEVINILIEYNTLPTDIIELLRDKKYNLFIKKIRSMDWI